MAGQVGLPESARRREALLSISPETCSRAGFGELAGGTAAACAALWCCCPCGIVNLVAVFVYKLPRAICRRAAQARRRRLSRKQRTVSACRVTESVDPDLQIHPVGSEIEISGESSSEEARRVEKEMWESFYGTGFWRSPSQKELPLPISMS